MVNWRRLWAAGLLVFVGAEASAADRPYGVAGCGVGSMAFGPKGMQSSAAFLNGLSFNQSFGISFGSSNCMPTGKGTASDERAQQDFFVANFQSLSKEIAQGAGDTVVAFASALGCAPAAAPTVVVELREDYQRIFAQPGAVAAFDQARATLRADAVLSAQCAKL